MKGLIIGDPLRGQWILANGNCCLKGLTLMTLPLFAPLLIQSKILIPDHPSLGFFALIRMSLRYSLPEVESISSDGSIVYRSLYTRSKLSISSQDTDPVVQIDIELISIEPSVQIAPAVYIGSDPTDTLTLSQQNPDIALNSPSQSPSTDSSMHFNTDDITLSAEIAFEQILMPTTTAPATDLSERFSQLQASISQMSIKQMRTQSSIGGKGAAAVRSRLQMIEAEEVMVVVVVSEVSRQEKEEAVDLSREIGDIG
ncbi:hypothetical protein F511_32376 [Dorcoceras hygrometricum]|uniref:Uncharacterized protein n=1 Tax=Dorcoceras hygrometricum TaxID=472368 RepID=A0A2Z7DGV6_9LAMI|nr:hypothetical protein F511_32376 [Dorcoceras hygrometricum]